MKKLLALLCSLAACVCISFGLTACSKSDSGDSTNNNTDQTQTDTDNKSDDGKSDNTDDKTDDGKTDINTGCTHVYIPIVTSPTRKSTIKEKILRK